MSTSATKKKRIEKRMLSPGEELYLARIEQKTSIPGIVLKEIALRERVPVTSLKILGGNPFIDVSGLDRKIQNKAQDEHLVVKEISAKLIQPACEATHFIARAQGAVKYLDKEGFKEALSKIDPSRVTAETLRKLEDIFIETYTDEGWASSEDCAAIAWTYKKAQDHQKVRDKLLTTNINMMACRRASSRAKRQATGCGLTSLDEAPMADDHSADTIEEQRGATEEQLKMINTLKKDKRISKTEVKLINKELTDNLSESRAEQIIKRIEDLVKGRIPEKPKEPKKPKEEKEEKQGGKDHESAKEEAKVLV
jgi:hypothetical protein